MDHSLLWKRLFGCHQSLVIGSCRKALREVGWLVCLIGLHGGGGEPWDIILEVRRFWVLYSEYQRGLSALLQLWMEKTLAYLEGLFKEASLRGSSLGEGQVEAC